MGTPVKLLEDCAATLCVSVEIQASTFPFFGMRTLCLAMTV